MKRVLVIILILLAASAAWGAGDFVKVDIYGTLWFYGWYNTAQFLGQELVLRTMTENFTSLGMSANPTRVGLRIAFPGISAANVSGVIETDFSGTYAASGSAENQPMVRLRHAFININNGGKGTQYGALIGSTWSVVSPLFPSLLNPGAGWAMGNLWQRMPQIQLYFNQPVGDGKVGAKLAAVRAMTGRSLYAGIQVSPLVDGGDASAVPQLQGEVYADLALGGIKVLASVSGAYGIEDYAASTITNVEAAKLDVSVIAASVRISAGPVSLSGEYFTGTNLDIFGAQFGQAVSSLYDVAYSSMGFWGELGVRVSDKLNFQAGYGMEDPEDTAGAAYYNSNTAMWATVSLIPFKNFTATVSLLHLSTVYGDGRKAEGLSCMFATRMNF